MKRPLKKEVSLPVGEAEQMVRLLKQVAQDRPLTPRIRRKLSQLAAEMEVRISLLKEGQIKISEKLLVAVLRAIAIMVHFQKEIREVASVLMSRKDQ